MTYDEAVQVTERRLIPILTGLYGLRDYQFTRIPTDGEWNVFYRGAREGAPDRIVRASYRGNRSAPDILSEAEFIRYLREKGCRVADVVPSLGGNLTETISADAREFIVTVFERAPGQRFVDRHYRYREGAPITEYYYNCGKTLGKIHQASKEYAPVHARYGFFDKYTEAWIEKLIPDSMPLLRDKLLALLRRLKSLKQTPETFGMVHFDYCDGNYHIDFENGEITVFDFDNACRCWYLYDLADLWLNGMGWIAHNRNVEARRSFMREYFSVALAGYRSETALDEASLDRLDLFIQVTNMEAILDEFEGCLYSGEEPEIDEHMAHLIRCVVEDIPDRGFFEESEP